MKHSGVESQLVNLLGYIQELYCYAPENSREEELCLIAKRSIYSALKEFKNVHKSSYRIS